MIHSKKALEAAGNASARQLARLRQSATNAIRKAQAASKRMSMAPDAGSALSRVAQSARTNTAVALLDSGPVDSALGFQDAASEAASGAKEPATTAPIEPPQSSSAPGAALFSSSPQSATNQKQDLQVALASGAPETPATAPSQPPPLPPPADLPPVDSHIQLGSLVQVTTEHADARSHHGAFQGIVGAMG